MLARTAVGVRETLIKSKKNKSRFPFDFFATLSRSGQALDFEELPEIRAIPLRSE